ncbi:unnamed protein product [Gemmataceae bacterium]|nr:unnamed protein product [Gemmataceae bacterium]VTT97845.1 unnamed protein product [Gemmataceae bacterium]
MGLQCGHGCEPWVIYVAGFVGVSKQLLQCGHGCEPWVMRRW